LFKLMERSPMTDDMMKLRSLVEKSADADLLREMIGFGAEKLMELEVGTKTGAAPTANVLWSRPRSADTNRSSDTGCEHAHSARNRQKLPSAALSSIA
jgi:hypothetical protein